MRPLRQLRSSLSCCFGVAFTIAAGACFAGCGGGGAASGPPPPPPPSIVVTVTPKISSVLLGNTQAFAAQVTNTANTSVTWSVNGVNGGNAAVGTISQSGAYTAPADLTANPTIQVTATSAADVTKSGSAQVTLTSDIAISVSPGAASVELGASQKLQASFSSSSHPDTAISWSLSGSACPSLCGTVDENGNYTAPQILPASPSLVARAQSVADPSKTATAALNITSNFALQITGPQSVTTSASATFVATLTPAVGSNPSAALTWTLSGAGCSGNSCGTLATTTTQFDANGIEVASANYVAPQAAPTPNSVTITVTPTADPSKKAQLSVAIQSGPTISISPTTATVAANHRITLAAQVRGATNANVTWSVSGILGGNTTVGQICVTGSSPCRAVTGASSAPVDYLAPGAIPTPNPISVMAQSSTNASLQASAQITVINHVIVSVQPGSATLAPLAVQGFTANALGTTNQSFTWQVQGTGCAVAGACGSITPSGTYTAPSTAPTPDAIQVLAISADDTSQSGAANVTVSTGANILTIHPASVYAGEANGFTIRVDGSGFSPSSTGTPSTILIGGTSRTTSCTTANECTAVVTATDTQLAGNVSMQIQNPDGKRSNSVSLVVVAPGTALDTIALTVAAPAAAGKDIVVVDPTTAGVSQPGSDVDLDIAALGSFNTTNNVCSLGGNPIALQRPSSGAATADICLFSQSGLDSSMTYSISGPGDVSVIAKQPAGLGIIHLTLQVSASAQAGARTLLIQNTNLDKTAASGVLEVQ
jgi:hypothetical protein